MLSMKKDIEDAVPRTSELDEKFLRFVKAFRSGEEMEVFTELCDMKEDLKGPLMRRCMQWNLEKLACFLVEHVSPDYQEPHEGQYVVVEAAIFDFTDLVKHFILYDQKNSNMSPYIKEQLWSALISKQQFEIADSLNLDKTKIRKETILDCYFLACNWAKNKAILYFEGEFAQYQNEFAEIRQTIKEEDIVIETIGDAFEEPLLKVNASLEMIQIYYNHQNYQKALKEGNLVEMQKSEEIIIENLSALPDINSFGLQEKPLVQLLRHSSDKIFSALVDRNPNFNLEDDTGFTVLMHLCRDYHLDESPKHKEHIKRLLRVNIDIDYESTKGFTATNLCRKNGYDKALKILVNFDLAESPDSTEQFAKRPEASSIVKMLPRPITITPISKQEQKTLLSVHRKYVKRLGFQYLGGFKIKEFPGTIAAGIHNPKKDTFGVIYLNGHGGYCEFTKVFNDKTTYTISNSTITYPFESQKHPIEHIPGSDTKTLFKKLEKVVSNKPAMRLSSDWYFDFFKWICLERFQLSRQ